MQFCLKKFHVIIPGLFFLAGCIGILLAAFTTPSAQDDLTPASQELIDEAEGSTRVDQNEVTIAPNA